MVGGFMPGGLTAGGLIQIGGGLAFHTLFLQTFVLFQSVIGKD